MFKEDVIDFGTKIPLKHLVKNPKLYYSRRASK